MIKFIPAFLVYNQKNNIISKFFLIYLLTNHFSAVIILLYFYLVKKCFSGGVHGKYFGAGKI